MHAAPRLGSLPDGTAAWLRVPLEGVGDTWTWVRAPTQRAGDLATRAQLRASGYEPITRDGFLALTLESQFAELLRVQREGAIFPAATAGASPWDMATHEPWALVGDLEQGRAVPVILGFNLPDDVRAALPENVEYLHIAQALPPPQLGVLALIPDRERQTIARYHVSVLGPDGVALCRELGETLIALAAPAKWWMYTPHLAAALESVATYEHARQEIQSAILATRGKERTSAKTSLAMLEQARERAEKIRQARERRARDPDDWQRQYETARDLARQLAVLYLDAHRAQLVTPTPAETPATIAASGSTPAPDAETPAEAQPVQAIQPPLISDQADKTPAQGEDMIEQAIAPARPAPRRRGRPRTRRPALVTQDPPAALVSSNAMVIEMMTGALLRSDRYKVYESEGIAEYQGDMGRRYGPLTITLTAKQDENWEAFLRQLNLLGDELVDTFCALLMLAISENGVSDGDPGRITRRFTCSQDDVLQVAGRKRSHGSYHPETRAKIVDHMRLLERMRVQAHWPTHRGTYIQIESPLIVVRRIGEYRNLTGEALWEAQDVELGDWAAQLMPPMSKQLVPMLRRVLAYHSERDKYAKRLGRYLTLQFRINAKRRAGRFVCSMRTLLDQSGIIPEAKHPDRTQAAIRDALVRLKDDGVIGDYRQVVDATPAEQEARERIEQRAYGWWHDYELLRWEFEPPAYLAETIAQIQAPHGAQDDAE